MTQTIEHLDFDPPCESLEGCSKTAERIGTSLCCGQVVLGCTEHKASQQRFISDALATGARLVHTLCGGGGSRVREEASDG